MRVSVIIPFYNGGRTLDWSIRSVIHQRHADWQLIIVDDGSTEEQASKVAQSYAGEATVIRQDNLGVAEAINTGARHITGDAVLVLSGDDWIESNFLEETIKVLERDSSIGVVSTDMHVFTEESDCIEATLKTSLDTEIWSNTIPATSLVRLEAFQQAGKYKQGVYEDWNFWIDVLKRGWGHEVVSLPLMHYRRHSGSSLSSVLRPYHDTLVKNMRALHPELYKT